MKFTELLKALYEGSEYTNKKALCEANGLPVNFFHNLTDEDKATAQKLNTLFEALTPGMSVEGFLLLRDFYQKTREELRGEEQFL